MATERWLMIVGAGPTQVPTIGIAQRKGMRVFATDMDPDAPGFRVADAHAVASTRDVAATVAAAREFHARERLSGVMTVAAEVSETVAAVADALGLPGISREVARATTQKAHRIEAFREAGVPTPRFLSSSTVEDAVKRMPDAGVTFPCVVKPVDSAGARGVQKVSTRDELERAVQEIAEFSQIPEFLLEEYLTGTEHSIEGVVVDDVPHWTGFSDRNYDKKEMYPPFFLEDGDTLPTALPPGTVAEVERAANAAVKALGITWGPVKGDILVDATGPRVIEMASRPSGDYFCWETVPLHNGTRLVEFLIDLATSSPLDLELLRPRFSRGVALRYYFPAAEGIVREIRGLEEARRIPGVHFVAWEPRWTNIGPGTRLTFPKSHGERVCSVMAVADSRDEAIRIAERAVATIEVVVDPDGGTQA